MGNNLGVYFTKMQVLPRFDVLIIGKMKHSLSQLRSSRYRNYDTSVIVITFVGSLSWTCFLRRCFVCLEGVRKGTKQHFFGK